MKRKLYLVRHGTTAANLENRFAGRTLEPLHPVGIKEMQKLGARLRQYNISCIISGPLPRTRQSAEILRDMFDVPVIIDDALTEINVPHWDGHTKQTIRERFGAEYPTWLNSPARFNLSECETLAAVQARGIQAVEKFLSTDSGGDLLMVSHLIVVRCIVLYYRNLPIEDFRKIQINNGSVTRLVQDVSGRSFIDPW